MFKRNLEVAIAKHFVDILYCLFLLLAIFKFTYSLDTIRDIELYDESFYLYQGVNILQVGFSPASWGPLYSMWYFLLSWFEGNNITLFYLNFKLLIFATSLLFYIYLRTLKIRPIISIGFAFIYSISTISLLTPRPGNFSILILLLFSIVTNFRKNKLDFYFLMTVAFLIIAFIRPEYTISFSILFLLYILLLIRSIFSTIINLKNAISQLSILLGSLGLLVLFIGNPLAGDRSFIAFSQHFAFLWMERNNINSPYLDYYKVIVKSIFGDINSISQAIFANPREFLIHIIVNFISYIHHSISILLVNLQNDFPDIVNSSIRYLEITFLFIVILIVIINFKKTLTRINYVDLKKFSTIFIVVFIPIFISSVIINPRFHYLTLQSIFLLAIIAYFLENSLPISIQNRRDKLLYPIIFGCLIFLLTPNLANGWCLTENICAIQRISQPQTSMLPNFKTIKFIQSLPIETEVNVLEADGGYYVYLGHLYHYIPETKKQENFTKFMQKEKINMVILTSALKNDINFSQDQEFISFIEQPEQWNFTKLTIPKTTFCLFVSSDLIESRNMLQN